MYCFFYYVFSLCNFHVSFYHSHSKANGVNQTIHLCFVKDWPSITSTCKLRTAENKEQDTLSNIMYIQFQNCDFFLWGLIWSRDSLDVDKLLGIYQWWGSFFWQNCRLGVSNFTKNVFFSKYFSRFSLRFVVISKFRDFLRKFISQKKPFGCVVAANRCKVFKVLYPCIPEKLDIQGQTLGSEKT